MLILIWMFPKMGVPHNGWFLEWKTLLKWDDLGVPLFSETSIWSLKAEAGLRRCAVFFFRILKRDVDPPNVLKYPTITRLPSNFPIVVGVVPLENGFISDNLPLSQQPFMLFVLLFLFRNLLNIMRRSSGNSNQKTYVICPKGWTLDHLKEVGSWTAHKRKINLIALKLRNRSKSCVCHMVALLSGISFDDKISQKSPQLSRIQYHI